MKERKAEREVLLSLPISELRCVTCYVGEGWKHKVPQDIVTKSLVPPAPPTQLPTHV